MPVKPDEATSSGMTHAQKQSWDQVRARGHGRFILREGFLRWGVPFGAVVTLGPLLYDFITHQPYTPLLLPWPVWNFVVDLVLSIMISGYLFGEGNWWMNERNYQKPTEDGRDA